MSKAYLLHRASVAASEAAAWAKSNPGLAALRRRDAATLTRLAKETP
jgi:hypothetical protein